jgi:hypothetical protein
LSAILCPRKIYLFGPFFLRSVAHNREDPEVRVFQDIHGIKA